MSVSRPLLLGLGGLALLGVVQWVILPAFEYRADNASRAERARLYNYYESKADLLGDTIESIWREIFFNPEDEQAFNDVAACISWIYKRLQYGNEQFPGFFSLHSLGFMKDEKTDGKKKMLQTWGHILNGLCDILKNDPKIRPDVFDEQFTEKQFADILFSLILVSMIRQDYNPSSILMLINKTLY